VDLFLCPLEYRIFDIVEFLMICVVLAEQVMKYERLLQAQEDSLLLLLFQDSFTWEIILAAYRPEKLYIRCLQLAILWHLL
jgi:hypothetical protein